MITLPLWPPLMIIKMFHETALGRGEIKVVPKADHLSTPSRPEFRGAILECLKASRK
jgi:ribosomal protein S24E